MNILITGGGCREPIDSVRCITNMSTGRTASFLADQFSANGASVTVLLAEQAVLPDSRKCRVRRFRTSSDLALLLEEELSGHPYGAVIHAAAVSDFRPSSVTVDGQKFPAGAGTGKLASGSTLTVAFEPVPKIADQLKSWMIRGNSSSNGCIVCFKLTSGLDRRDRMEASFRILSRGAADYVVSNDLSELCEKRHPFEIFGKAADSVGSVRSVCRGNTLSDMGRELLTLTGGAV